MSAAVNFPLRTLVDQWLSRLLPARCLVCGCDGSGGADLCADCRAQLPWQSHACPLCALPLPSSHIACGQCQQNPPPLDASFAALTYANPLDRLLPRLKFHNNLASARLLSGLMTQAAAHWPRPQAIIPIPLHRSRLRQRGFDQALELARPLAHALKLPLRTDLLQRQRATCAQTRLSAAARRRNLRQAFAVNATDLPQHVALLDDVMTTGATLHSAAKALKQAGVQRVDAWVCARVEK